MRLAVSLAQTIVISVHPLILSVLLESSETLCLSLLVFDIKNERTNSGWFGGDQSVVITRRGCE
jgi:hypothetical protein